MVDLRLVLVPWVAHWVVSRLALVGVRIRATCDLARFGLCHLYRSFQRLSFEVFGTLCFQNCLGLILALPAFQGFIDFVGGLDLVFRLAGLV